MSLVLTAVKVTESTPADVLVTVGAAGRLGVAWSGPGPKIAKPCWPLLFTEVKSPPRNRRLPSVAIERGRRPLVGPTLVSGVQCPIEPSVMDWSSRWCGITQVAGYYSACGNPPGAEPQS